MNDILDSNGRIVKLDPCPFCGGECKIDPEFTGQKNMIGCKLCGMKVTFPIGLWDTAYMRRFNIRTSPPEKNTSPQSDS